MRKLDLANFVNWQIVLLCFLFHSSHSKIFKIIVKGRSQDKKMVTKKSEIF